MKKAGRVAMGFAARAARKVVASRFKTLNLLHQAYRKLDQDRSMLPEFRDDVSTLLSMVKAWAKGEYPHAPTRTLLYAVGAVVYFVSPIDAVFDFLPGGYVDDLAVMGLVLRALKKDLNAYRAWQNTFETTGHAVGA